jgi:hypothetical protein
MERTDDESNKQPVILPPMIRIAYCTPSLHIPGGVERVLTTKANYLAENGNYDIYILLTDGKGKPPCYTLSPKVKIIQLDIDFEELWELPLWKKVPVYLKKQRIKIREKKSIKDKKFDSKQRESKDKTKNKKPNKSKFRKTTKRG